MKILIVDDEFINSYLLEEVIIKIVCKEIDITKATNGKEALELCKYNDFDLIFMDVQMPVMNGVKAAIAIKKIKNVKIIAFTAYLKEHIDDYDSANFDGFLGKPICIDELKIILEL